MAGTTAGFRNDLSFHLNKHRHHPWAQGTLPGTWHFKSCIWTRAAQPWAERLTPMLVGEDNYWKYKLISLMAQWLRVCTSTAAGMGSRPCQGARIAHALRLKNEEKIRIGSLQSSRFHKLQVYKSVFLLTPCHGFSSKNESSEEAATFLIQNPTASFLRDARRLNLT